MPSSCMAGQPPKTRNERNSSVRYQDPVLAPELDSKTYSASHSVEEGSLSAEDDAISKSGRQDDGFGSKDHRLFLENPNERVEQPAEPHLTTSLPLWAHRSPPHPTKSLGCLAGLQGRSTNHFSFDNLRTEINDIHDSEGWGEGEPLEPDAQLHTAVEHKYNLDDAGYLSSYQNEEVYGQDGYPEVVLGNLPATLDYQLGLWVHNTRNEEMPFSEKLQRSAWESQCLARL